MNSYNDAYNKSRRDVKARDLQVYESQRIDLVNAIKREYGISDFSTLSEGKKQAVRNLITEMWSPKTGLNKKGEDFIQNGNLPLNESSSPARIENAFKKGVIGLLKTKFSTAPIFNSSDKEEVTKLMEEIKAKVDPSGTKSLNESALDLNFKEWFFDAAGSFICGEARKHVF